MSEIFQNNLYLRSKADEVCIVSTDGSRSWYLRVAETSTGFWYPDMSLACSRANGANQRVRRHLY